MKIGISRWAWKSLEWQGLVRWVDGAARGHLPCNRKICRWGPDGCTNITSSTVEGHCFFWKGKHLQLSSKPKRRQELPKTSTGSAKLKMALQFLSASSITEKQPFACLSDSKDKQLCQCTTVSTGIGITSIRYYELLLVLSLAQARLLLLQLLLLLPIVLLLVLLPLLQTTTNQ